MGEDALVLPAWMITWPSAPRDVAAGMDGGAIGEDAIVLPACSLPACMSMCPCAASAVPGVLHALLAEGLAPQLGDATCESGVRDTRHCSACPDIYLNCKKALVVRTTAKLLQVHSGSPPGI